MKIKNIWLNLADGTKQYHLIKADIRKVEEANAVYAKGFSQNNLDADLGVGIEIELDNVESWIADFRHSEYWCMPAFGNKLKDIPDETQGFIYKKNNGFFWGDITCSFR